MKIKKEIKTLCCGRTVKFTLLGPPMSCKTKDEVEMTCPRCKRTDVLIVKSIWKKDKEEITGRHQYSWRIKSPLTIKGGKRLV